MLSKFSVRKPYTVVVGVVMVLILGFVSLTEMTADLLPNINLPYSVVMTTYVGASPEEVEMAVTKPVESSMATISNVNDIMSVSAENYSLVIMEFTQDANMDSVSLEMRESLDQLESIWDNESIGSPIIMKLNPDMMPIMVAAVSSDEKDALDLTDFMERSVTPELESIAGVASVSPVGTVEESIQVIIRQDKIDAMNEKIYDALDGEFDEAREQIADAKKELNDGQKELNDGWAEILDAEKDLVDGKKDLEDGIEELEDGKEELNKQKAELAAQLAAQQVELQNQKAQLADTKAQLDSLNTQKATASAQAAQYGSLLQGLTELKTQIEAMESMGMDADGVKAALEASMEDKLTAELTSILENAGWTSSGLSSYIAHYSSQAAEAEAQAGALDAAAGAAVKALNDTLKTEYKDAVEASKGLAAMITAIDEGLQQLMAGNTTASIEMGSASAILEIMNGQLESAKDQMESAQEQLDTTKDQLKTSQESINDGKEQLADSEKDLLEAIEDARESASAENVLTADTIKALLGAQNFSMPAGYVTEEGVDFLVRVGNKVEDPEALKSVTLLDMGLDGLEPVVLSDVADVIVTDNADESYAKINGNDGIILTMQKQTGYSTGDVSDKINGKFEELEEEYPDLHFTSLMDQGIYIDLIVNSVLQNILSGAVLAILVLFLFLKDIRPTFIIACSIPFSVLAALVLMYFSGITLNVISLSGLALGIGMLVDNSIVVIENIFRMRAEGHSAKEAAIEGAREVSGAIIASTLTTVCVFLPIVFTKGITKQLFVDMGLTIGYSLLASLIVALSLVPMMGAGLLKNAHTKEHRFLDKVHTAYGTSITWALSHKAIVMIVSVVFLVVSFVWAISNGTAFMPEMESTQMSATIKLDEDATMEETAAVTDEAVKRILEIEDISDIGAMIADSSGTGSLTGDSPVNSSSVYIILDEENMRDMDTIKEDILSRTSDLDCEVVVTTQTMDMSALGGSGVSITIKGKELDVLYDLANQTAAILESMESLENVSDGMGDTTPELRIVVDKAKAGAYNMTVAQVLQQVSAKIADATSATTISTAEKDYEVFVSSETATDFTREDIQNMEIKYTNSEGKSKKVPLKEIASFEDGESLQAISRISQTRYITVSASVADGYNIGLISPEIEERIEAIEMPKGYSIELAGESEMIDEAMIEMLKMLALAVVFIYMVMVAQFQSLKSPFIVMFTIPLAFTGGFLALAVSGMEVSVIAMIGFVMLSGVIVNNGIVLVDYVNQLRAAGMEKKKALAEAGKTRLRPIVMTALTTILGLSTLAAGFGMGADMAQPMAVVTIGGMIYGTLLTLWVVPCIYDILNPEKKRRKKNSIEEA